MNLTANRALRALVRLVAVAPVFAALSVAGATARVGPSPAGCAQASGVHRAALVVEHSDGSGHGAGPVIRVCVSFTEDSIHGDQLLARSGVESSTGYGGQAVCQIDYEPQDQSGCLSGSNSYWALYVSRGGGSWSYSSLGFASQTFRDGDAEGFRYEGQSDGVSPPSPAGVCPVSTPTPARTATPAPNRATPRASARSTPIAPAARVQVPSAIPSSPATAGATATATATSLAAVVTAHRSPPIRPAGAGVWAAAGLGGALLLLMLLQLARGRRRSPHRPPP